MVERIEQDAGRFREMVRGHVRENLKKYMSTGEMIGRQGRDWVSIPVPQIDIPRFRFGRNQGGVGQGEGQPGDPLGSGDPADGSQGAGNQAGNHILEVEISLDQLARILADELELPNIQPKGKAQITSDVNRYTSIRRVGPESLRHFKRTYREALKRQLMLGAYDPTNPRVIPVREDRRYRSWQTRLIPESNAVVIYMMDVSGSMGDTQKEIVRLTAFWIDTWLRSQYARIEVRYVIHDATAREVDQHTFYHTRESGGTVISSAYELCKAIVERHYPPEEWNIYGFHFSDGDNWGNDDNQKCGTLLREHLLPASNLFCYGQVAAYRSANQFLGVLRGLEADDKLVTAEIANRDAIYDAIKQFLGKGK